MMMWLKLLPFVLFVAVPPSSIFAVPPPSIAQRSESETHGIRYVCEALASQRDAPIVQTTAISVDTSRVLPSCPTATPTIAADPISTTIPMSDPLKPSCLKTVERSCLNLAANCIDSVGIGNLTNVWDIRSCAAAGTCYGAEDLIHSINCQTSYGGTNTGEANLNYSTYATIVGSCAYQSGGCAITQQKFVDWYYGTLKLIKTAELPNSTSVFIAYYNVVRAWSTGGATIWYSDLNDWYHGSSGPAPVLSSPPALPASTSVVWNPNAVPPAGAVSQTFVKAGTTTIIPIPTMTTTVVVVGVTITLAPGGTPISGIVPTDVTQPDAVTPTFDYNPVIPTTASTVTFVSGTWTSTVPVPTSTNSPVTIHGPPDDGDDDDDDDWWLLVLGLFGPLLIGTLPASVGVVGALTPVPIPPPSWPDTASWSPPPPQPGKNSNESGSPEACSLELPPYFPPYDPDGEEPDDDAGPLRRRGPLDQGETNHTANATSWHLFKRSNRSIRLGGCNDVFSANSPAYIRGLFYGYKNPDVTPAIHSDETIFYSVPNAKKVSKDGRVKEHVFELRYISDFVKAKFPDVDCDWMRTNMWAAVDAALYRAIDQRDNFVLTDEQINKAKSNVVNNNAGEDNNTPCSKDIKALKSLNIANSRKSLLKIESRIRAFGVLGDYFTANAGRYRRGAQRVQDILARITPLTPIYPPLDARWNEFVRDNVRTYSDGITSRGANLLNAYRAKIDSLLAIALAQVPPRQPPPRVPACLKVYHSDTIAGELATQGINWEMFVVPAIQHPPCNPAGTIGSFILRLDPVTQNPITYDGNPMAQIYAVGNEFYGMSFVDPFLIIVDMDMGVAFYPDACAGVHKLFRQAPGRGLPVAQFRLDCHGRSGAAYSDAVFMFNGQPMVCFSNNDVYCAANREMVQTCFDRGTLMQNHPVPLTPYDFHFAGQPV